MFPLRKKYYSMVLQCPGNPTQTRQTLNPGVLGERLAGTNGFRRASSACGLGFSLINTGALIIRIRSLGPLYDNYNKEPRNNIGNYHGPYIFSLILALSLSLSRSVYQLNPKRLPWSLIWNL